MNTNTCGNCRYFDSNSRDDEIGECCVHPPVLIAKLMDSRSRGDRLEASCRPLVHECERACRFFMPVEGMQS